MYPAKNNLGNRNKSGNMFWVWPFHPGDKGYHLVSVSLIKVQGPSSQFRFEWRTHDLWSFTNQVYHAERKVEHGSDYAGSVFLQLMFSCPLRSSKVFLWLLNLTLLTHTIFILLWAMVFLKGQITETNKMQIMTLCWPYGPSISYRVWMSCRASGKWARRRLRMLVGSALITDWTKCGWAGLCLILCGFLYDTL